MDIEDLKKYKPQKISKDFKNFVITCFEIDNNDKSFPDSDEKTFVAINPQEGSDVLAVISKGLNSSGEFLNEGYVGYSLSLVTRGESSRFDELKCSNVEQHHRGMIIDELIAGCISVETGFDKDSLVYGRHRYSLYQVGKQKDSKFADVKKDANGFVRFLKDLQTSKLLGENVFKSEKLIEVVLDNARTADFMLDAINHKPIIREN